MVGRDGPLERASAQVRAGVGVAILGDVGLGKSALLREVVRRAGQTGSGVVRVVGAESMAAVPFAPFVDLLPTTPTADRTEMFRRVVGALRSRATEGGLVLGVDDAQHLDEASLGVVITAARQGVATVCLAARSGSPMRADLVDLWTDGIMERLDLAPLEAGDVEALLRARLGAVDPGLVAEAVRVSMGNPLVLHELIEGGVGRTIEPDATEVWRLHGDLAESPRLADLVRSRLDRLDPSQRRATELVSVGAPLPPEILREAMADHLEVLADLDDDWFVPTTYGDAPALVPAHPLYGEVLRANLGEVHRRSLCATLVDAAVTSSAEIDPLRVALWQRDAGGTGYAEVAAAGAAVALGRHDPLLAEVVARPFASEPGAAVCLARALSYQRRHAEAEEVLDGVSSTIDEVTVELASARAHNLAFGLGRVEEAVEVLAGASERVANRVLRGRLGAERGMVSAVRGDFADAEAAGRSVVEDSSMPPPIRASAYVSLALALAMTADCDGLEEIIGDALHTAAETRADLALAEDQIAIMHVSGLWAAGRIAEAVELADAYEARSRATTMHSTWLATRAMSEDLAGRLRDGAEAASAALRLMADLDPFGLERQARGLLALERGQMGDGDARDLVDGLDFDVPNPRLSVWVDRGRTWATAATGAVDEAAAMAQAGGRRAVAGEHVNWGAPALHDAVRLGRADLVVDDLEALRSNRGAHLIDAMADHAAALDDRDPQRLLAVADTFAGMGAVLLAAEAAAQAAGPLAGEASARAAALSMQWESRCQEPATPALQDRPDAISARQLEVAALAATGLTSPEIAADRFVSVRTVDNHLRSVYRALGVAGRDELGEVLAPAVAGPSA